MISKRGKFRELSKNRDTRPAPSSTQHNEHQRRPRPPPPFPVLLASGEHPTDEGLAGASKPPARPPCSELHPTAADAVSVHAPLPTSPPVKPRLAGPPSPWPASKRGAPTAGRPWTRPCGDCPARPRLAGDRAARHPQGPSRRPRHSVQRLIFFLPP
jgi:hypothetical protein